MAMDHGEPQPQHDADGSDHADAALTMACSAETTFNQSTSLMFLPHRTPARLSPDLDARSIVDAGDPSRMFETGYFKPISSLKMNLDFRHGR
jgi:hypothetical protein